jgi:hypothetical protein
MLNNLMELPCIPMPPQSQGAVIVIDQTERAVLGTNYGGDFEDFALGR